MKDAMTRTQRIPKLALVDKIVLTMDEACSLSGMGHSTLYQAIKDGRLEARMKGHRFIVLRAALDRYIDNLPLAGGREKVVDNGAQGDKSLQDSGF